MPLENSTVTIDLPATDHAQDMATLATAESIVRQAQQLAEMAAPNNDDGHALLREILQAIRDAAASNDARHNEILARLDEIRSAQIVDAIRMDAVEDTIQDVIEDEVEDTEAAPVSVNVSQASDGSAIEKETVISDAPAVAEERANKKTGRVWL